jgi:hypothetical protein
MSTQSAETRPRRTVFFVDGFNVYHSLLAAGRHLPGVQLKWLDLPALLGSTLPLIDRHASLVSIHYFTAYAHHLQANDPDKLRRHQAYVRALTARKVAAHLGKFQPRAIWCRTCQDYTRAYEEKETDVSLACELLKLSALDFLDVAVLVSGDTDLAPAVRTFQELHPNKRVLFAFPFDRANRELEKLAPGSFSFSKESYITHQFPAHVRLPSGKTVAKPVSW